MQQNNELDKEGWKEAAICHFRRGIHLVECIPSEWPDLRKRILRGGEYLKVARNDGGFSIFTDARIGQPFVTNDVAIAAAIRTIDAAPPVENAITSSPKWRIEEVEEEEIAHEAPRTLALF